MNLKNFLIEAVTFYTGRSGFELQVYDGETRWRQHIPAEAAVIGFGVPNDMPASLVSWLKTTAEPRGTITQDDRGQVAKLSLKMR